MNGAQGGRSRVGSATSGARAWQATRRLRSMPEHANLPIVGLSASAFADEVKRALDAGMDEYLTKPIDLKALRRVLASVAREDRLGA
mgnify:CR=1 FL=1